MIPITTTYLKPRTWFKYLFLIGPAMFLALYYFEGQKDDIFLYVALGSLAIFFGVSWLLSKVHVMIDNDEIIYKTAFTEKRMRWSDIKRSYTKLKSTGKSSQRYWYFENVAGKSVNFSMGMYSRESLQAIAEALIAKCREADIEDRIKDIAQGKFPWYII